MKVVLTGEPASAEAMAGKPLQGDVEMSPTFYFPSTPASSPASSGAILLDNARKCIGP
jgi:hypothetical protein